MNRCIPPPAAETELARLRAIVADLAPDERAAIHALARALRDNENADPVAAMAPHIGRARAEAAHKIAEELAQ